MSFSESSPPLCQYMGPGNEKNTPENVLSLSCFEKFQVTPRCGYYFTAFSINQFLYKVLPQHKLTTLNGLSLPRAQNPTIRNIPYDEKPGVSWLCYTLETCIAQINILSLWS